MELQKLRDETFKIFNINKVEELGVKLFESLNDEVKLEQFEKLVDCDLSVDWLQMIFQYYVADRKEKMQDFTPTSVSKLISSLTEYPEVIDMCAGSGSLTIANWVNNKETKYTLYEIDENVIPYLLFNLVIRNISSKVIHGDVLNNETYKEYVISKGIKYGKVEVIGNE